MKAPARLLMVSAATATVVVAGWQVRPDSRPDAALVTTPPAVVLPVPAIEALDAAVVVSEESSDVGQADINAGSDLERDAEGGGDSTTSDLPAIERAAPVEGYLSAAPLNIEISDSDSVEAQPDAAAVLDCRSYIGEEIRRDEADLIDWDALDNYVELSEDDYANLEIEFVPYDENILQDGERPTFTDMSGPVEIESLEIRRLLAVTDRCWQLGVYEEISESIYHEIYGDE